MYAIAYSTTTTRTITNARAQSTILTLNSFGNPTQITGPSIGCGACDHAGNTTSYAWDGEMNRIRATDGRGNAWTDAFDPRSNLVSRRDPGGNLSVFAWSELHSTTVYITVRDSELNFRLHATWYAYDAKGNLLKTTNAKGDYTEIVYTPNGFVNRSRDFRGNFTGYEYSGNGYLTKMTDPLNQVTRFGYDAWGRMTSTTSPGGNVTSYEYDKVGRRTKVTDPLGNRVQRTDGTVVVYTYDADDRLTRETSGSFVFVYEYDANGNLVREYDEFSSLTQYAYDYENRLTRIVYPQGETCTYTYTPWGERVSVMAFPCTSTTYLGYDFLGSFGYADLTAEYDNAGNRQARYTHGPGIDEPLGVSRGGSYYSLHADGLGSITRMTDSGGTTVNTYRYDAWGRTTSESGTLPNPYRYAGREKESGTALYYYRARMYDPDVGRFTGKDPAGMADGTNLYAYVGGNPVNALDPSGAGLLVPGAWRRGQRSETTSGERSAGGRSGMAQSGPAPPGDLILQPEYPPKESARASVQAGFSLLPVCVCSLVAHSTVTLFARLRGLSMGHLRRRATWYAKSCRATVTGTGLNVPETGGTQITSSTNFVSSLSPSVPMAMTGALRALTSPMFDRIFS